MIPKIIHYCWFGGNPLPELAIKCIESWKKYLPDYEIKEWNESNFDINCCAYVREAYEAKKWAFVSDYARFWILYQHGGLYFDTDVELIKSIDDLIVKGAFMGCEPWNAAPALSDIKTKEAANPGLGLAAAPGLGLAAAPGLGLYKEVLDAYECDHFTITEKGGPPTVVERMTKILLRHGLKDDNDIQFIEGIYIYPSEYFCPLDYGTGQMTITENTRSIHHYVASWHSNIEKKIIKIQQRYALRGKVGCKMEKLETLPLRIKNKIDKLGLSGMIKFAVKRLLGKSL